MSGRQKILALLALLLLFNFFLVILFSEKGFVELVLLEKEKKNLVEENEALVHKNLSLYYEIDRLKNDPEFIESVARKRLGMIAKGEVILKLNPQKAKRPKHE